MTVKTIVFDFGKVVGFFDHRLASRRLTEFSPYSPEALHEILFESQLEDDYESGRISSDKFVKRVREEGRLSCDESIVASAWADIFWPNPEVCSLLPSLSQNYRLLLGSNTNELHSRQFTRQFAEVFRSFHAVVLSHEIGTRKPRPEFFNHCLRLAECAASECLFIDDLPANVEGARSCGWRGIQYQQFEDLLVQLAHHEIRGLPNNCGR